MRKLFIISLMFFGTTRHAFAGLTKGNGGDAVKCSDGTVQLFDYVEGRLRWKLAINAPYPGQSTNDVFSSLILALARINPSRAQLYTEWKSDFDSNVEFVTGVTLLDLPDTGDGYLPINCELKQVALQRQPRFPEEKRYTIDDELFKRMSNVDQAGLIMHELILREASELRGQEDSLNARYFNSHLADADFGTISLFEYFKLIGLVGLEVADNGSVSLTVPSDRQLEADSYNASKAPSRFGYGEPECDASSLEVRGNIFADNNHLRCARLPNINDPLAWILRYGASFRPAVGGDVIVDDRYPTSAPAWLRLRSGASSQTLQIGNTFVEIRRVGEDPFSFVPVPSNGSYVADHYVADSFSLPPPYGDQVQFEASTNYFFRFNSPECAVRSVQVESYPTHSPFMRKMHFSMDLKTSDIMLHADDGRILARMTCR